MSYSYNTSSGMSIEALLQLRPSVSGGGGQRCGASLNLFEGYAPNPYSGGYAPSPYTYADQQNNNWGNGQYDESEYDEHEYYEQQEEEQNNEQQEDNYQEEEEEDQGDDQGENQGEDQEEDQEDEQEEDDADYDDGINYGTCSSPNCTNICHPEASDRCPICAPRAYDLPQFRYCEAVLVHEVYPSIDEDPYYGYDRGYKYVNNPGAHVDNSKPGDLSLIEDEIFCNHPGCYNKINMRRQSYCSKHR